MNSARQPIALGGEDWLKTTTTTTSCRPRLKMTDQSDDDGARLAEVALRGDKGSGIGLEGCESWLP